MNYLKQLGVTAIELLPVHHIADEAFLADRGLTNYWGYSTIGFLAPHSPYAATGKAGQEVREFKGMVKALHKAGIEVILDVVYNHTAEGNHLGPMLSFRGVDNAAYYRLVPDDLRHYMDYTGTGNTLNVMHPSVLRLIMDSLRYWVIDCHVDGFRFDLASALARELYDVDRLSAFFDVIHQDPVLSQVKLIAEPWDVGPGGYQVGNFPVLWSEWNGIYRDTMRDFWRGEAHVGEFAQRLTGSSDLYQDDGRHPFASINFITAHDGFPLADLVAYNAKHNEANKEDNRDGTDDNRSWNCGEEGPTDDPEILTLRARQQRNFLATLLLSQGTPMLLGGDEFGRSQGGNNNGWCQDNELSWFDWSLLETNEDLLEFTRKLIALRRAHAVFRRRQFLYGREMEGSGLPDAAWFSSTGERMRDEDWNGAPAGRRRVPQRRGDRLAGLAWAPGARRVLPAALQRPPRGSRVHAAGEGVRRALDDRARHRRRRRELRVRRRRGDRPGPPLAGAAAPRLGMTALRATYRLQLGGGFGFAQARELVPYLRDLGVSHVYLPPSFQAREGSTHGYDVVDPSSISNELGGEEAFSALAEAVREAGMGIVLDIVPNHMATDDANRFWADRALREQFFDIDEVTGRHRRFFDIDHLAALRQEDPEVFEATHALALRLVREGVVDGLRIDHPDGLADPAGYFARLREGGVEHIWVEKILDPGEHLRDWPVDGTVGYEFLNDAAALFVDPAGEAPLTDLWVEISGDDRRFGEYAFEAKLEQARTAFAPEVARLAREAPARVTGLERALASFPVYRTYVEPWSGRVEEEDRRRHRRGRAAVLAGARAAARDAGLGRVRHALPADDAAGDGQGRRGHGVLPLRAAAGAQRRRRRPVAVLAARRRLPRRQRRARGALPEQPARHPDARHQALRRRARPDRRAGRDGRRVRGARAALAERQPLADVRRRAHPGRAVLHLPDAARRLADLRGAARRLPREGDARGQAAHELDRARRAPRGRGAVVRARAAHAPRVPARLRALPARAWPRRATPPRSASCCSS